MAKVEREQMSGVGRLPAELVIAALDHLREQLPTMMANAPIARDVNGNLSPNRIPRAALDHLERILGDFEMTPDADWWRDYFLLAGLHMVLTPYGWEPGDVKDEYDPEDILDEVNG